MSLAKQRLHGLFWALGMVGVAILASMAWHQIDTALAHCFLHF
jgi:hypothetical protein